MQILRHIFYTFIDKIKGKQEQSIFQEMQLQFSIATLEIKQTYYILNTQIM